MFIESQIRNNHSIDVHPHAWMDGRKYGWMEKPLMERRMQWMDGIRGDDWKEQLTERVVLGFWDGWMDG